MRVRGSSDEASSGAWEEVARERERGGCTRHAGRVASRHSIQPRAMGAKRRPTSIQFSTAFLRGSPCELGLSSDYDRLSGLHRSSKSSRVHSTCSLSSIYAG